MMNEFCKGGGCTAKLGPGILDKVLKMIPKKADPNLLVGFDHSDDAAVYQPVSYTHLDVYKRQIL